MECACYFASLNGIAGKRKTVPKVAVTLQATLCDSTPRRIAVHHSESDGDFVPRTIGIPARLFCGHSHVGQECLQDFEFCDSLKTGN